MPSFELIIFDCDGVLVDSERLAVRTETEILASLGWPLSESEVVERFVGRSAEYMQAQIEEQLGRTIDWEQEFETRYREVFEQELRPVEGIVDILKTIDTLICVASSGTHDKIRFSLSLTGLLPYFAGRIFSVQDVSRGKPAPDLFLHAAQQMGVSPEACAVVEDSPSGVEAALTAGMSTFAFSGGVVPLESIRRNGVPVFDDMRLLPGLLVPGARKDLNTPDDPVSGDARFPV
jgi:HAD superfamily hydrolase (TIGR01509 family)